MKRISAVVALLVLLALGLALDAVFGSRTATLEWDYNYVSDPPCNDAAAPRLPAKTCVTGFNVFVGTPTKRRNQQFVPNAVGANGRITDKKISLTMPLRSYGNIQFCVVAVGRAPDGQTLESSPLCATRLVLPFGIGKKK